ncbi:MAG: histone deacetylase [Actinobacteria bacterium]|nr:histone deacetylase [Actinomycetota bacterium]
MLLIYDDFFKKHFTGIEHPENPGRLEAIKKEIDKNIIKDKSFRDNLQFTSPLKAKTQHIQKVHDNDYIKRIKQLSSSGKFTFIDNDTVVSKYTYDCAMLAAGACINGIDYLCGKRDCSDSSKDGTTLKSIPGQFFAIVRPPGHHAYSSKGGGFCIFNNIAIAANYAMENYSIRKTAIIDFDVHHGNGTQDIFYNDSRVFYISLHEYPHYPGSGHFSETGEKEGLGFTMNIPLSSNSCEYDYLCAFTDLILPVLIKYQPELILVSAGFDAHKNDNLSSIMLDSSSYYKIMQMILFLSDACTFTAGSKKLCNIGIVLEGGYDYDALSQGAVEILRACIDNKQKSCFREEMLPGPVKKDLLSFSGGNDINFIKNELIEEKLLKLKKKLFATNKNRIKSADKNKKTFTFLKKTFGKFYGISSIFVIFLLCLIVLASSAGCRKYDGNFDVAYFFKTAPEQSVIDFMHAMNNHDADYIYSNFLLESDSRNISHEKFSREMSEILSDVENIEIDRIVYLGYDENMTKVVIEFRVFYVNGQHGDYKKYIYLLEENGKWKIVFDKTFI